MAWLIFHYLDPSGKDLYQEWLDGLADQRGRVAVQRRVDRLAQGNFGDHEFCGEGVWELRVDFGPGYRVYYALSGKEIVLLLCAGAKRTQNRDIKRAVGCWNAYGKRSGKRK